ncbi:hypothetical protein J2T13_004469 [Paenibacillus sp. DS2015]|uniref:hypothetical protein n=1 Tax=Paenibacillus sp. DS2015 TaxID=3373917 RepID=UPI003D1D03A3
MKKVKKWIGSILAVAMVMSPFTSAISAATSAPSSVSRGFGDTQGHWHVEPHLFLLENRRWI